MNSTAARVVVPGRARGPALISAEPISFLGDVDIRSGRIVGDLPSVANACLAGTILFFPASMGSAGAWRFIHQLRVHGTHPAALVPLSLPDPSVVQGAMLAGIPLLTEPEAAPETWLRNGDMVEVDGAAGLIRRIGEGA